MLDETIIFRCRNSIRFVQSSGRWREGAMLFVFHAYFHESQRLFDVHLTHIPPSFANRYNLNIFFCTTDETLNDEIITWMTEIQKC